uniref:Uncharacterized protein n=1 Tax=Magnetospirillum gryphiswaldense TaxID=55518 RepID=A4U3R8_9PROT|nr:conserved hypothetical protein [Magnetospirillum gryphiswaldense MSR-1]
MVFSPNNGGNDDLTDDLRHPGSQCGFGADFLGRWLKAFAIAYVVGVPVIYFLAPVARRLTGRLVEMP